jgi:hypothetical protein
VKFRTQRLLVRDLILATADGAFSKVPGERQQTSVSGGSFNHGHGGCLGSPGSAAGAIVVEAASTTLMIFKAKFLHACFTARTRYCCALDRNSPS